MAGERLIPGSAFMKRLLLFMFLSIAWAPMLHSQSNIEKLPTSELVITQQGNMPIIISAPHGGTMKIPDCPERKGDGLVKGGSGFSIAYDRNVDLVCRELAAAIEKNTGKKPYFVYAKFSRRYADANRPPEVGYEHEKARPIYETYHKTVEAYCNEVQKTWGCGLLLDIHGQGAAKDTVYRGTQNGKTVKLLIDRFGEKAHTGPKSFFGLMAAKEFKVHPTEADGKELAGFTGGYIVQHYGSHDRHGIDAIQLELGFDYRDEKAVKDVGKRLADVVGEYSKLYLPEKPLEKK